jgi:catechol 2,3-dioxygenase-like lactoylglutathione lyase family enzyme
MNLLVNLDVPDLAAATDFYVRGLGLQVGRKFSSGMVELLGGGVPIGFCLLQFLGRGYDELP